jgi:predicted DNA-binding antitoxin AbrB/MazE fold protein
MVRVNARYQQGQLILEQPLDLPDGAEVVVEIFQVEIDEQNAWELACSRLETELDLTDSSFDDWRKLYGISGTDQPTA